MVWAFILLALISIFLILSIANIIVKKIVKKREQKGDK